ncbi:MAG: GTPase [Phycisphaerae bacterium]|jgi:tRNA modification GTPase
MNRQDHADAGLSWRLVTPSTSAGAVSCFELLGDVDECLRRLGVAPVAVGDVRLRELRGIDHALVARPARAVAHLMPHGGIAVTRAVEAALLEAGIARASAQSSGSAFPEARTALEARLLAWLARAASPRAVDLLLAQPRRWRDAGWDPDLAAPRPRNERDRTLDRLIDPPLVVALGPSNVGKSTLLNALARRRVSIVADQPGTTRDHVGALLDLDGLTVRYVDAPGFRDQVADPIEARAIAASLAVARSATLVLRVGDAATPCRLPAELASLPSLDVQTRADLHPRDLGAAIRVERTHVEPESTAARLAAAISERLVPAAVMSAPSPWVLPEIVA